jgi:hypothetical protein
MLNNLMRNYPLNGILRSNNVILSVLLKHYTLIPTHVIQFVDDASIHSCKIVFYPKVNHASLLRQSNVGYRHRP